MNREELERAQRELDREKCRVYGHGPFDVMQRGLGTGGAPSRVVCSRCSSSWKVETS